LSLCRFVALSLCTTAHPLHTIFTKIVCTSVSAMTMRPDPRPDTFFVFSTVRADAFRRRRCACTCRHRLTHERFQQDNGGPLNGQASNYPLRGGSECSGPRLPLRRVPLAQSAGCLAAEATIWDGGLRGTGFVVAGDPQRLGLQLPGRARSHRRFVLTIIHFIPDSLRARCLYF
jgi:hypothetical protein